jgi:hypothetical protein
MELQGDHRERRDRLGRQPRPVTRRLLISGRTPPGPRPAPLLSPCARGPGCHHDHRPCPYLAIDHPGAETFIALAGVVASDAQ